MRFDHVSIAVESIERAYAFFDRYFPVHLRSESKLSEQVSGSFRWMDFYLGGAVIELIEDLPGSESFVTRFIRKHGEGLHHLSIELNQLEPVVRQLRAEGVRVVDEQEFPDGGATAFISPRAAFGVLIQFWQVPDFDAARPEPLADGLAHFDHVALAVGDIDRAAAFFVRHLGARSFGPKHLSHSGGNFMLAHAELAGMKLEFIQSSPHPARDDFVGRFIERHGEGLHHLSIDLKEFDATVEKLKAGGVRVVDEGANWRGERQFFISPRSAFGTLIQVWDGL